MAGEPAYLQRKAGGYVRPKKPINAKPTLEAVCDAQKSRMIDPPIAQLMAPLDPTSALRFLMLRDFNELEGVLSFRHHSTGLVVQNDLRLLRAKLAVRRAQLDGRSRSRLRLWSDRIVIRRVEQGEFFAANGK